MRSAVLVTRDGFPIEVSISDDDQTVSVVSRDGDVGVPIDALVDDRSPRVRLA